MEDHSKCKQIKFLILKFFDQPNANFNTSQLISFVKKRMKIEYIMPDTILRMMRHLKADGLINYECVNKKKMHYKMIFKTK